MPGGSLGFISKDVKWDHTPKERKELGLGTYGVEYIKVEKIEHSACSVPANQEALARHLRDLGAGGAQDHGIAAIAAPCERAGSHLGSPSPAAGSKSHANP